MKLLPDALAIVVCCQTLVFVVTQPIVRVIGKPRAYADAQALHSHVTMLSRTLHPRSAAHPENLQRVAGYVEAQFRKASNRVSLQTFVVEGHPVHKVIARFGPDTGRTIVIGAHYDSARLTPGADDNASGVAGLIELSRLLADRELLQPIELVAYLISLEMTGMFSDEPGAMRTLHQSPCRVQPIGSMPSAGTFRLRHKDQRPRHTA